MPTEMPYGPWNARYDPSNSWELTDKGRKALETFQQKNMGDLMDSKALSQYERGMVFAWEVLNGLEQGKETSEIYREASRYRTHGEINNLAMMFDTLVNSNLIVRIDFESLPDAFKDFKDFE